MMSKGFNASCFGELTSALNPKYRLANAIKWIKSLVIIIVIKKIKYK